MLDVRSEILQTTRLALHRLEAGPPAGLAVILLHDDGGSAEDWLETLQHLPSGLRGLALDLRRHGRSEDLPIDPSLGLDDVVGDVLLAVRYLQLRRYALVARGVGAAVAWKLCQRAAPDLIGLALIQPVRPDGRDAQGDGPLAQAARSLAFDARAACLARRRPPLRVAGGGPRLEGDLATYGTGAQVTRTSDLELQAWLAGLLPA